MCSKKYNFSDGVGVIRSDVMREIAATKGWSDIPSALQIRYKGNKGVLTVYDDETYQSGDPNVGSQRRFVLVDAAKKVLFRKSMIKFDSPEANELELVTTSKYAPGYLNRQLIQCLSACDVLNDAFEHLQSEHLKQLNTMLSDRNVALAVCASLEQTDLCNTSTCSTSLPPSLSSVPSLISFVCAHVFSQWHAARSAANIDSTDRTVPLGAASFGGEQAARRPAHARTRVCAQITQSDRCDGRNRSAARKPSLFVCHPTPNRQRGITFCLPAYFELALTRCLV